MNKYILGLCFLTKGFTLYAQTGVNTKEPLSSLHVKEVRTNNNINANNSADGLIIPQLTKAELALKTSQTYNSNTLQGNLIYVSDVSGAISGPSLSKVTNITSTGFYFLNSQNIWTPIAGNNVDTSNDAWVNNPTNTRVELGSTSKGLPRPQNSSLVITDTGNVGINELNPTKRLDINAANSSNQMDFIKINNLSYPPLNTKINSLQIDNNGNISKRSDDNIEGEILRLPLVGIANIEKNSPKFLIIEGDPLKAPNLTPNKITSIVGFVNNTSNATEITLPRGLYKYDIRLIGFFETQNTNNSVLLTTYVNNSKYAINSFGSNTKNGTTGQGAQHYTNFITSDFIELTQTSNIKFELANNVNKFSLIGYVPIGGNRSYRSVILIQRIK